MEWLELIGIILGLILTATKIVQTVLEIISKYKKLTTDKDSDEQ
ncbi:MAG: hypothetical protein ACQEQI_08400 [Bacillota bacterium]